MHLRRLCCCLMVMFATATVFAQQTGALHGRVTASDGSALPGVTVEARSNVLPQPRVTTTDTNGDYRLPRCSRVPYTLQFTLSGMQTTTRKAEVLLVPGHATRRETGRWQECRRTSPSWPRRRLSTRSRRPSRTACRTKRSGPCRWRRTTAICRSSSPASCTRRTSPRPQRRRERSGQRLSVRRRQRHHAAVRRPGRRAEHARHRAGQHHQGRCEGGRLRSRRRLSSTRSASRERTGSPARSATSSSITGMVVARSGSVRRPSRMPAGQRDRSTANVGGRVLGDRLFFLWLVLSARMRSSVAPGERIRRLPAYSWSRRTKSSQAHFHADAVAGSINGTYRNSHHDPKRRGRSEHRFQATTGTGGRHRSSTRTVSRTPQVINNEKLRDLQVHRFPQPGRRVRLHCQGRARFDGASLGSSISPSWGDRRLHRSDAKRHQCRLAPSFNRISTSTVTSSMASGPVVALL